MAEYARSVWLSAHERSQDEQTAIAWVIKNRLAGILNASAQSSKAGIPPRPDRILLICREFLSEKNECEKGLFKTHIPFDDRIFCRAFSTVCLVWNDDLHDPTKGATRCHRHDQLPDWAAKMTPSALIGSRLFYAPD